MNKSPLISSAGRDHVLLSKQLAVILGLSLLASALPHPFSTDFSLVVLIICGGILFVRTEVNAVKRSLLDSKHIQEHNEMLSQKNKELEQAKQQVLQDEEE